MKQGVSSTSVRLPWLADDLLTLWHQFHDAGQGPTRVEFTPFQLKPWLGWLDIYEVLDDGRDFRMRLGGTETTNLTGENWVGKTASQVDEKYGNGLRKAMLICTQDRIPQVDTMPLFQKDFVSAVRLLLPVFNSDDPAQVHQIFLALFPSHDQTIIDK